MSPRGVAIPEVRRQLFQAAERVLLRDGPARLTGRAITREAECATGLLYNHFADLDEFLAEFVIDRARQTSVALRELPARAGAGTVVDNVLDAVISLFGTHSLALAGLVVSRPSIVARLGTAFAEGLLEFQAGERAFAAYLDAERELGRIVADADAEALSLALVGAAHQLLLTHSPDALALREMMRRVVVTLIGRVALEGSA
jgi:AcrR family transcriptional regulator